MSVYVHCIGLINPKYIVYRHLSAIHQAIPNKDNPIIAAKPCISAASSLISSPPLLVVVDIVQYHPLIMALL